MQLDQIDYTAREHFQVVIDGREEGASPSPTCYPKDRVQAPCFRCRQGCSQRASKNRPGQSNIPRLSVRARDGWA
jgi:hypothetical protein